MIDFGIKELQFTAGNGDTLLSAVKSLIGGYRLSSASGELKTEYNDVEEVSAMPTENNVTQEQLKFAEQDTNHKLDMINMKIDALTNSVDAISTKANNIDKTVNEIKTTTAVLSEKESTTRALAWAIVIAIIGGLIKLFLFN